MTVKEIGVCLPAELIEKLDVRRGDVPRSKYLRRLVEAELTRGEAST